MSLKTNIVSCQFRYRISPINASATERIYDEYDRLCMSTHLKNYYYRVPDGLEVAVGDAVVVHGRNGFQVCEVSGVNVVTDMQDLSYVVDRINMGNYIFACDRDTQLAQLAQHLRSKRAELEGMLALELLAEKDEELAQLLQQFRSMGGTTL